MTTIRVDNISNLISDSKKWLCTSDGNWRGTNVPKLPFRSRPSPSYSARPAS